MTPFLLCFALISQRIIALEHCAAIANEVQVYNNLVNGDGSESLSTLQEYMTGSCLGACIRKTQNSIRNRHKTQSCRAVGLLPDLNAAPTGMEGDQECQFRRLMTTYPGFRATCKPRFTSANRFTGL